MTLIEAHKLRARFARALSELYGQEVPAYDLLLQVAQEVNTEVARNPDAARLGSIARVTAERHGAIRLGTPRELSEVARIFGAMGMYPVGYYDLRDAAPNPVPVVSTAFRPTAAEELARNPFRIFTSLLAVSDRRFFTAELQQRVGQFLQARRLFPARLLSLADRAEAEGGLDEPEAGEFITLATTAFKLSREPVDEPWYRELEQISSVAADIGGVTSTHINHLTPRVLDIDLFYARMQGRGIEMIDTIQGPPRWDGPDVLLRQTSFRALAEARTFRRADGTTYRGSTRVRFGEVESRGVALTASGRAIYDELAASGGDWNARLPNSEHGLAAADLAFFTFSRVADRPADGALPPSDVAGLLQGGWIEAHPIVYEDFLPKSAAGIFQSNLTGDGTHDEHQHAASLDAAWLAGVLDRDLADPLEIYAAQRAQSLEACLIQHSSS